MPTTGPGPGSLPPDPALDRIVDEVTRKLQAGQPLGLDAYRRASPELMEPLARLLPALLLMDFLGDVFPAPDDDRRPPDSSGS
jgi:hypothetical protein